MVEKISVVVRMTHRDSGPDSRRLKLDIFCVVKKTPEGNHYSYS